MTATPVPLILDREQAKRLLLNTTIELGARARFALGLSGLSSAEVVSLDVHHVSTNGVEVRTIIAVPNKDSRREHLGPTRSQPISDDARWLLSYWLETRRSRCPHHRKLLPTYKDERGALRCGNCHEVHNFLAVPVFDSRERDRLSLSSVRHEFQRVREALGLDEGLHFDSLRETYLASVFGANRDRRGQR